MNRVRSFRSLFESQDNETLSPQQILPLIGLAALVSLLLALIPWLAPLSYPFRLLLTIVHELGHGIAAILTGGNFVRFEIAPGGSGLAYTTGGWRFVVIPAGYLGAALFGAALILLGRSYRWSRMAMIIIGAVMILFSLRYGAPSILTVRFLNGLLTTLSGLLLGSFILWVGVRAAPAWIVFWLHLLAIQAGLAAFSDLATLLGLSLRYSFANDAQSMAQLTFIPAPIWALLWAVIATGLIGGAIWLAWLRPGNWVIRPRIESRELR